MKLLAKLEEADLEPDPFSKLIRTYIPYIEIGHQKDLKQGAELVLAGPALVVEGMEKIIMPFSYRPFRDIFIRSPIPLKTDFLEPAGSGPVIDDPDFFWYNILSVYGFL